MKKTKNTELNVTDRWCVPEGVSWPGKKSRDRANDEVYSVFTVWQQRSDRVSPFWGDYLNVGLWYILS